MPELAGAYSARIDRRPRKAGAKSLGGGQLWPPGSDKPDRSKLFGGDPVRQRPAPVMFLHCAISTYHPIRCATRRVPIARTRSGVDLGAFLSIAGPLFNTSRQ